MAISIILENIEPCSKISEPQCYPQWCEKDAEGIMRHVVFHCLCQEYTDLMNDLYSRYPEEEWASVFQTDPLPGDRQYWSPEQAIHILERLTVNGVRMETRYWQRKLDNLSQAFQMSIVDNAPLHFEYDTTAMSNLQSPCMH